MTDLASALRAEISRLARREFEKEVSPLKAELRSLQKVVEQQRTQIARLKTGAPAARAATNGTAAEAARLTPKSIRSHRQRLGLSQKDLAELTSVTPVAVYLWESGRTRPRGKSVERLLEIREMGVREAQARLNGTDTSKSRSKKKAGSARGRRTKKRR